jgi:hypothetical protein
MGLLPNAEANRSTRTFGHFFSNTQQSEEDQVSLRVTLPLARWLFTLWVITQLFLTNNIYSSHVLEHPWFQRFRTPNDLLGQGLKLQLNYVWWHRTICSHHDRFCPFLLLGAFAHNSQYYSTNLQSAAQQYCHFTRLPSHIYLGCWSWPCHNLKKS